MAFKNIPGLNDVEGNLHIQDGQAYIDVPATHVPTGTTVTIDWNNGNYQVLDLGSASGNVTATFSNCQAGASYVLEVIQGASARTLSFSGVTVTWADGSAPTITTNDDAVDVLCFLAKTSSLLRGSFNQAFA